VDPRTRPAARRPVAATAGVAAALVALGAGELGAGLLPGAPSPVLAVGELVIDRVPIGIERAAIDIFGTADKVALVVGIVLVAAAAGAALGVAARRRLTPAALGFAAFALLGAYAVARVEGARPALAVPVLAVAAATGVAALRTLLLRAPSSSAVEAPDASPPVAAPRPPSSGVGDRRSFLRLAGVTAAGAGAAAAVGRQLSLRTDVSAERAAIVLPEAPMAPVPAGADLGVPGLSPYLTPNDEFFRIDTALRVPQVDPTTWRLRIDGLVDDPLELTYDELLALPQEEHVITLACVSNEVGGDLIGNARWQGVRLDALLERAGVRPEGTQVVGRSVDGFTVGFPTEVALDGRDALVAVGMNGEPLPVLHGFPARLVVPGLYGYVSATKWLSQIELVPFDAFDAYWIPRGWSKEAPVKTHSRIDVPRRGQALTAGTVAVAGVAWAPNRGVAAVEVRVDDGSWQEAELASGTSDDTWRPWVWRWDAPPGHHALTVRATDGDGETQTDRIRPVAPDGATGHHRVTVEVT
jgi:DMSO/TMAO reductase YedYZ molybdopterin-dependent catalytic subunit